MGTTLRSVVISLVQSIDLLNYLLKNHHRRTAVIAMHLGRAYGLETQALSNLVLAAALHDIGALTVAERDQLLHLDIVDPHPHAKLGAFMLNAFAPFQEISRIIYYHHWRYEADAQYDQIVGPVPMEAYLLHLSDRVDILIRGEGDILEQKSMVLDQIMALSGTVFLPKAVDVLYKIAQADSFWLDIDNMPMTEVLKLTISDTLSIEMTDSTLEALAFTFSKIVDCRSRFTASHSIGVSEVAYKISKLMGKEESFCRKLRVSGLLHDIGKIGISNELIEKNGPLTDEERRHVSMHAYYTSVILRNVEGLDDIAKWAAHHHEDHLGKGYPDRYEANQITEEMDILAYADIFTALCENRPYREGLSLAHILSILEEEVVSKHGEKIFKVISANGEEIEQVCKLAICQSLERLDKLGVERLRGV